MKTKYKVVLFILIIVMSSINRRVYADEFCDKLQEHSEYTNLCRYTYIDGKNPISANLYIGNGYTMVEWSCNVEDPELNKNFTEGICYSTMQQIKSNESEKKFTNKYNVSEYNFIFSNDINVQSCPSQIYIYTQSLSSINRLDRYFKWVPKKDDKYAESNWLSWLDSSTEMWRKLEISKDCKNDIIEPEPEEPKEISCDLIDQDIIDIINEAMSYIRIVVPVLLLGLIIFDFASAMFASSEDKMKKAQSKAIKRIIIAVIIFFVPTFINLIFNIANDVWSNSHFETCGIK